MGLGRVLVTYVCRRGERWPLAVAGSTTVGRPFCTRARVGGGSGEEWEDELGGRRNSCGAYKIVFVDMVRLCGMRRAERGVTDTEGLPLDPNEEDAGGGTNPLVLGVVLK